MTNPVAIGIAASVAALVAIDLAMEWGASLFLVRRFIDLLEWLAVWR